MIALKDDSPHPLHYQLEQAIKQRIADGQWQPGMMIASERELMRLANVSRSTVRQAIASLIQQGVLERQHGRGTFVKRPKVEQEMGSVYSFSQQFAAMGLTLTDHLIQRYLLPADPALAIKLGLSPDAQLIFIQRLRFLDDKPIMLCNHYLPHALYPELIYADIGASLYRHLTQTYDVTFTRSADTLESITADPALALHLQVSVGAPIMLVERTAYAQHDLPAHVGVNFIRGDAFRFRVNLAAQPTALEIIHPTGDTHA